MTKISIIMPVYNDADRLNKSIQTIANQTLKDIELICINDGSQDNSLEVLNELANKHDFIKVLSQENQGSGKARNYGMSEASGEYIGFLDADDIFIDNDALERLYDVASKNDAKMVAGNIKLVNDKDEFSPFVYLDYYTDYGVIQPEQYGIPWSFYKNIYKREFLQKEKIVFPDLLRGQDPVFLAEILSKIDKIYTVPTDVYAYFYVSGTNQCNTRKKRFDHMMHYKMVFDYLSDVKFDEIRHLFRYQMLDFIRMMGVDGGKDILDATREIFDKNSEILKDFEEYFYFKHEKDELKQLINFKNDIDNPRISVIIDRCEVSRQSLESIFNQTFSDIEIISTSPIDDSRVKQVDEITLNHINGKYIYIYNPREILKKNCLKEMYYHMIFNESDIGLFNIKNKSIKRLFKKINTDKFTFNHEYIDDLIFETAFNTPKFYKKEFLEKTNLNLNDNLEAILKSERISYLKKYLGNKKLNDEIDFNEVKKELISLNCYDKLENQFNSFQINHILKNINSDDDLKDAQKIVKRINISDKKTTLILSSRNYDEFNLKYGSEFKKKKHKNDEIAFNNSFKDKIVAKFLNKSEEYIYYKTQYGELKKSQKKLKKDKNKIKKENKRLKKNLKKSQDKLYKLQKKLAKFTKPETINKLNNKQYSDLTIAIKSPNPNGHHHWGDYFFSLALKKSFEKIGFNVIIQERENWYDNIAVDINIVLRGSVQYKPNFDEINIMWNISHPDMVDKDEYEMYDICFISSEKYANKLNGEINVPVKPLLQCTDPDVFYNDENNSHFNELLFVGVTRGVYRQIVKDAIDANLDISVYGMGWEKFIDEKYIKNQFISNEELHEYYSSCKILLNDHWEDMKDWDFPSNRLFDALACGAFVISDKIPSAETLFEGNIVTYEDKNDLKNKVEYYLSHEDERRQKALKGREIVLKNHTFDNRADSILKSLKNLKLD